MSKGEEEDKSLVQFIIQKAPSGWQKKGQKAVDDGIKVSEDERRPLPGEANIKQKIQEQGLMTGIRIAASSQDLLKSMIGSLDIFTKRRWE